MEKDLLLTCDAGTTGCKCTVFDGEGNAVCAAHGSYGTVYPKPNWSEQNMDVILGAVYGCIRELLEQTDARRIACVGLSGTMNGCIPVDADGNALYNNIIHSDCRAEGQLETIRQVIAPKDYYALTGNRLDTHCTFPKILWFKDTMPALYRETRWWLNTKDYIYGKMTGRFGYTDYSDASLTCALDIRKRVWAEELIRGVGLDAERMPVIRPGHDVSGTVTEETHRLTGLLQGTPVTVGGGDGACCARGAGVSQAGNSYTNIGSSAWVSVLLKEPVIDPEARIFNYLDTDGQSFRVCGTVQCGAAAFDWALKNLAGGTDGAAIAHFEAMAREIAPGAEGVLFLPTLMGWRTPYWDANTRGCLAGFTLYHDKRHIARAVYEGIAYALNSCAEILAELGSPLNTMMLTGGGAKSELWADMLAAVYGVPTQVHQTPGEATSLGAAMVAGVGVGLYENYAAAAKAAKARSTHPVNPAWRAAYQKYYPLYAQMYERLRPINDGLAALPADSKE